MKKMKLFKRIPKQTMTELRGELSRAHLIISFLAMIIIVLLTVGPAIAPGFDPTLSSIANVFLSVLALTSLWISYYLFKNKK